MRQLKPRTILVIGLPGSLLVNASIAALVFLISEGQLRDWWVHAAILSTSVWLLLSVPILIGMAVIRGQIGQLDKRQRKIRAAIRCCSVCFAITVLGLGGGYLVRALMIFDLPILTIVSILVGTIGGALMVLTGVNILVRSFTNGWDSKPI